MRLTFFKLRQAKRFDFKPRYYDAEKEAFEARVARIKRDLDREKSSDASNMDDLRERMRSEWKTRGPQTRAYNGNLRIMIIAGLLFIAFYLLLFTDLELPG